MANQFDVQRYARKVAYLGCPYKVLRAIGYEFGPEHLAPSIATLRRIVDDHKRSGSRQIVRRLA